MVALYPAAAVAVKALDNGMRSTLPDEIVDCIQTHAGIAAGSIWIPVPGADIAANLTGNIAAVGIVSLLKFIPGISTIASGVATSATMYGSTLAAAWIYLLAIANWVKKGKGSGDDLSSCIKDVIAQNRSEIDKISKIQKP
ncbi:MAG: hypothetical protein IKT74_05180 [Bacteroidales bacterium]|nr:hypothetical protein [Bacteroidales bacterium]